MKLIAILFIFAAAAGAQTTPEVDLRNLRSASGDTLSSPELPRLKLKFSKSFKYVGGHSFILYNVARAEQHFYVEADKDKNIKRMYWVQYEGYLPSNKHVYDYSDSKKVNIGGLDFYADAAPNRLSAAQGRPDSDTNKGREFLASKGYKMASDDILLQRLVNMVTPDNRSELMIVYIEVLTPTGLTAADLNHGGIAAAKWPEVSAALLDRARKGMQIIR